MKNNLSKKDIRQNIEATLINEVENLEGSESSRKVKKVIKKASKNIAAKVKLDIKKNNKRSVKQLKRETKLNRKNKLKQENLIVPEMDMEHNGKSALSENHASNELSSDKHTDNI